MKYSLLILTVFAINLSFAQKKKVDLVIYNATIYTVDKNFAIQSAIAIDKGKIVETGATKLLLKKYNATESKDANGKFIYPGFIDAHAHFFSYGLGLQTANLVGTTSWEEILNKLQSFAQEHTEGWLIGRGWDQNDWSIKEFPTKEKLDMLFPDRPVILSRVDGHAAIANKKALDMAGIQPGQTLNGGQVEMKNGDLTGILVDNAVDLVASKVPSPSLAQVKQALLSAQQNCFAVGLTTVDDCGIDYGLALLIDSLQKSRELKMRIFAMLSDDTKNYNFLFKNGKIKTERLNVRAFKVYADGALGSRGAALLKPYSDKPGWSGFLLSSQQHFDSVANIISQHGFQMCTHAIGDSGNRTMLNIYAKYLKGKNDRRWRIEHAQVINPSDFHLFGQYNIIPSVQPTHATSDMYWAKDRLGADRVKGAYAFRQLLNENGWIPLGTDFPVEDISPFKTFYAAVFRMDAEQFPKGGFQMENALTRQQAIKGMTIWAAKSNFEEKEKGSLEKGKWADLIILDKDLMRVNAKEVLSTSVLTTIVGGETVYSKN
ncbi:MAG TPA: amidohydrolase family protein [Flavisolibacter sp.]|nr:amidohydrolase family protein [Flavisolibacter sp.]